MGVAERLYEEAAPVWRRLPEHPFVVELYKGTLPLEKFKFYVLQDYNYLLTMARVFAVIASKTDIETAGRLLRVAEEDATIELENYKRLLSRLGLTIEDAVRAEPAPVNVGYMSFMLSTALLGSPAEGLAAVLPCFWSYLDIARAREKDLEGNPVDVYVEWARAYLSPEYERLVEELRETLNNLYEGAGYERLRRVFLTATRFEWLFWEMSYRMEGWPV